ncbi:MAG: hypothetical protein Q8K75_02715 [Chlamydiales bacterium]|nr:hypothetical protein [Chlamydiales bacterium]
MVPNRVLEDTQDNLKKIKASPRKEPKPKISLADQVKAQQAKQAQILKDRIAKIKAAAAAKANQKV